MSQKGKLTTWKDERGFGFIKPEQGGKEVFLHISALKGAKRRPKVGDTILYKLTTDSNGKVSASNASIQGVASQASDLSKKKTKAQSPKKSATNFRTSPLRKKQKKKQLRPVEILIGMGSLALIAVITKGFGGFVYLPWCNIKGNISHNTGSQVYHMPGMKDYQSTVIDPAKGERWFCSEQDAIANGWSKAPR
ncbi:MAG: cold shock domain-containing protein [Symploca sp. SIO2D2]|nr:cold shock domain-containing protein [Symploca sp. SIO2D2]